MDTRRRSCINQVGNQPEELGCTCRLSHVRRLSFAPRNAIQDIPISANDSHADPEAQERSAFKGLRRRSASHI